MISIVLPTRNRPDRLRKCISSCIDLSSTPSDLEFLIYIDADDTVTKHETLQQEYPKSTIKTFVGDRLFSVFDMQNYLAERASGEIVGYLADDMYFLTPNWDQLVKAAFVGDQIWLVYPHEKYKGERGACHGFLSCKAINIVGSFMPRGFHYNWGDTWLWHVYRAIGRANCLHDVHIVHENPAFIPKNPDLAKYQDDVYAEKFKVTGGGQIYIRKDKETFKQNAAIKDKWIRKLNKSKES